MHSDSLTFSKIPFSILRSNHLLAHVFASFQLPVAKRLWSHGSNEAICGLICRAKKQSSVSNVTVYFHCGPRHQWGESKTDINRKRKYTSSEEMLLYCLNMGVDMCAFVHVFGCRHIWKPGAILFLNQYCLFGGWDSIFHCARTHQEIVRLVGVGNPEIHLPGWHFLV